jgi:hypothetical protein
MIISLLSTPLAPDKGAPFKISFLNACTLANGSIAFHFKIK